MEETVLQDAVRHAISYHDIQDVVGLSKHPSTATVQLPETKRAEIMYCRPGFDNVPAY
ncbi:unnamed protein product [Gongylonema pulchrum]|uniref:Quinolinate synthase n=1 Tax=Gongylonema pulchrum TaxID=637853 RepID=A0A183DHY7_9BILA|nr:unnamed protein product [Gongylonema pulchrum]